MVKRGLSLLLLMLSISSIVGAQQSQNVSQIYIQWNVDKVSPNSNSYVVDFQTSFENALAKDRVTVTWVENENDPDDSRSDVRIHVGTNSIHVGPVWARRRSLVHERVSPILFDYPSQAYLPIDLPFDATEKSDLFQFAVGLSLYTINRCDLAIPHLEIALTSPAADTPTPPGPIPSGVWLWQTDHYLGNCAVLRGDYPSAVTFFERIASAWNPESTVNLAWTYLKVDESDKAFALMSNLIANPITLNQNAYILPLRAQLYALAERYDDAINDLNAAIELTPENPELYTLRGQTYLYLYEWDNVLTDYNQAIELDPTYADAYFLRGVLYYSILQTGAEHYPDALADFQRYLELAPDGEHAADAKKYADQIQAQQNALNP